MSAHAYTEDQQAQRNLTRPLPEGEEVEQPAIGLFAALGWTTVSALEEVFCQVPSELGRRRSDETHSSSAEIQSLPRNGRDGFHSVPDFSFEDGDAVERVPTFAFLGPMQQPAAVALTLLTSSPTVCLGRETPSSEVVLVSRLSGFADIDPSMFELQRDLAQTARKMETVPIPRLRLRVTATAETIIRSGHPWLFADSIREKNRAGRLGELAVILDRDDKFLAIGLFDPESLIRVRVLHTGKPATIGTAWWQERLNLALARREGLFDAQTNGYRCIHGESDGWPGLVLDRYDRTFVLKLYTAAWLPRLDEIVGSIRSALHPQRLVLRLSRNIQSPAQEHFHRDDGQLLLGEKPDSPVTFLESGLRFEADVLRGQKTGFFLDQRENRRCVESLARGRDVLNAFSFSGGFSLYAARGGAKSVTDLDISEHALAGARRNFALNQAARGVAACRHDWIRADAFEWLAAKPVRKFDLIVLDPPSLAKREAERARAIGAYRQLNADGLRWLAPSGVLVAASCSAHVSTEEFFGAVRQAARESARPFTEWQTTGHPPDHPATFSEAQYLKAIYLRSAC